MNNIAIEVANELKKLSNLKLRYIKKNCIKHEQTKTSLSQGIILSYIYDKLKSGENVYQKDIEQNFSIRRSTATESMKRLESQGYITRKTSQIDARLKEIMLTEKALACVSKVECQMIVMEELIGEGITEEELLTLKNIIKKMQANLKKQEQKTNAQDH